MKITLNGEPREIPATNLGQVISSYHLNPEAIVIELNGSVARKQDWATTPLHDGDQVEIVSFVGGG